MNDQREGRPRYQHYVPRIALTVALGTSLSACDTKVTNPGRYEDKFLDLPSAHTAMANGSARLLSDGLNMVSYTTAAISRELFPGGSTGSFGITPKEQQGILAFDDGTLGWGSIHQARFVAEQGYARFKAERSASSKPFETYEPGGRVALWAGYANRLLGENWCQITLDGGPPVSPDSVLRRAENWFTAALAIGQAANIAEIKNAALAGRASVRRDLGNWPGALADAVQVPTSFSFQMKYASSATDQYNRIFWAGASTPYRAHTVWRTQYDEYYTQTKDSRVKWALHPTQAEGDAAVLDLGKVPFHQQQKFTDRNSPINLSSGREMRLIEIEGLLRGGNYTDAVTRINELRTAVGAPIISAASLEEAWTLFKRERGIELWLEGRRMGDLNRWKKTNTPGALHSLELPGPISKLVTQQDLCVSLPKSELETNPNAKAGG